MKKTLLFLLFFCNSLYSQSTSNNQTFVNLLDYYKSNLNDLKDENGTSIFSSIGLDSLVLGGETDSIYLGYSVSKAGDVNGDGYSDVIVGAFKYDNYTGRAFIYFGGINMDNIADVTITGQADSIYFGYSVSTAGDVNGDGYSDVIVGAFKYDNYTGRAYIYFGGINMDNIADVIMTGVASNNRFGRSVSSAGDVNGDGYSDIIVGDYLYIGHAFIFFGGVNMNNIADLTITGETTSIYFGYSVSTAGDVNGDGYSDVIVGASIIGSDTGKAYIFYGGFIMNNIADVKMTGEAAYNDFGSSVSSAGDVNGDGYSDVIIGAYGYENKKGRAYIYYGGSPMNNTADVILTGKTNLSFFGTSVSSAGDVNGDGYSDVIIGTSSGNTTIKGKAFIYFGGVNMNNVADFNMSGVDTLRNYGISVSSAGDVNGDGYSDVIVGGDYDFDGSGGRAYLYFNLMQKPELTNPINNSNNNPVNIDFKWKRLNSTLYYVINISTDSVFNDIIVNDTIYIDTSKTVSGFQKNTKYFWRVKAKDTSGATRVSATWNYTTIPPLYINIKMLLEGMYSPIFNQLTRKDTTKLYLRNSSPPYSLIDSAYGTIDSIAFSGSFNFLNASSGIYYIVVKHFNSIETWSKSGGESLNPDGIFYYYDFTTANSQAYWNNLKLKGTKYCLYSGDVNQDGFISLLDVISIYNDASNFVSGSNLSTDLTGEGIVDLADLSLCYNNSSSFIRVRRP